MTRHIRRPLSIVLAVVLTAAFAAPAFAGHNVRSSGRNSVSSGRSGGGGNRNAGSNRNASTNRNTNVNSNRNTNVNRNTNINVDRDINIDRDVDIDVHGGYYGGGHGCCYHPVATAAAVTAAAVVTAAIVGSIVSTLPTSCQTVIVNGFAYQQCGSTWYQPQMSGSSTTYVVVNAPG